jgi:hypothetical protein
MAEDEEEGGAPLPGETERRRRRLPPMATWNAGRMLGQLKRRNPQIVEEINEYAKATGSTPTQVLEDAVNYYIIKRRISQSNLTIEQIYDAWMLLREMQKTAVDIWREQAAYLFSEEYAQMLELRQEWVRQATEGAPAPPPPRTLSELEKKFLAKLDPLIDWLLDWTMESFFKAMAPMGMKPPPGIKRKIPVTVTYEEEETGGESGQ